MPPIKIAESPGLSVVPATAMALEATSIGWKPTVIMRAGYGLWTPLAGVGLGEKVRPPIVTGLIFGPFWP